MTKDTLPLIVTYDSPLAWQGSLSFYLREEKAWCTVLSPRTKDPYIYVALRCSDAKSSLVKCIVSVTLKAV